jgi:hypothetical protein
MASAPVLGLALLPSNGTNAAGRGGAWQSLVYPGIALLAVAPPTQAQKARPSGKLYGCTLSCPREDFCDMGRFKDSWGIARH